MVEILVPLGSFAMIFGIVWVLVDRSIKIQLIKHGADARTLKMDKSTDGSLRAGLLLVGVGLGILMGYFVASYSNMQEEVAYFSMTFLMGGLGLLLYHFINKKQVISQGSIE
jgi:hypothetical protein